MGENIRQITMPLRPKKKFLTFAIEWEIIIEQWGFDSTTTLLCEEQKRQKMFSWESHICYYTLVSIRKILLIRRRCTVLPTFKSFEYFERNYAMLAIWLIFEKNNRNRTFLNFFIIICRPTVCRFKDYSVIQILREINFE